VASDNVPTVFVLASRGFYVHLIMHDLVHALGSAGHIVTLTCSSFLVPSTAYSIEASL